MSTFTNNEIRFGKNRNTKFTNETAGEIATYVDVDGVPTLVESTDSVTVGTDAAVTLTRAVNRTVVVVPQLTADRVYTMPAQVDGISFTVIYTGAAVGAYDVKFSCASSDFFIGGIANFDIDGGTVVATQANGSTHDHLNVLLPEGGTTLHFASDGTNWHVGGMVMSDTIATFTTS